MAHGFLEAILEVIIHRTLERGESGIGGGGFAIETGDAHGFETHAGMFVIGGGFQPLHRVGQTIAPVAHHTHSLGASARLGGLQHAGEQGLVDDVVPLVHPQRFEHVVFEFRVLGIEHLDPFHDGIGNFFTIVFAELDLRTQAHVIFRFFE